MVKNFKNLFLQNQEAHDFETWYTASGTWVLPIFHMMTMGWPWLFLWQGQICFRMLLHGWKLIQHWVLMYFQVCSNSTHTQHSGERYRTNGPLVPIFVLWKSHIFLFVSFFSSPEQHSWRAIILPPASALALALALAFAFALVSASTNVKVLR